MAPFRHDRDELDHGLPWLLMQNGPVTKYWQQEFFDEDIAELSAMGFAVRRFDCSAWGNAIEMHDDLRAKLALPDYTGRNLDALADSLQDMEVPDDGGLAIALDDFDGHRDYHEALLAVLADSARRWLLFGRIQPVLLRTADARYRSPNDLGATPAHWNRREWLDSQRRG